MGKDSEKGKYTSPEGSRTWEYITAGICGAGMFSLGVLIGWNSPSLAEFSLPNSRISLTPEDASTLMACLAVGQMIAFPCNFFIVDTIGRKNSILISAVPMITSWGMILVAEQVMVLIVARLIAGLSFGMILCITPIYTGEILSPSIRGSMLVASVIAFFSGILFMFVSAPYLGVRVTSGVCLALAIIFVISMWFIPESPYFLMKVGRIEEAEATLEKLRGKTDVTEELELIKATIQEKGKSLLKFNDTEKEVTSEKQSAFKLLFTIRGNLKAFLIGIILTTMQHLSGLSTILSYCHVILHAIGSGLDVYIATIIFSSLQVFSSVLTVFVVDRFGRRPLLFASAVITGTLLGVVGGYFYLMEYMDVDVTKYAIIPLCSILALVMTINVGIGPMPGVLLSEIYSSDVKVLANCIVGVFGSFVGVLSTKGYLVIASSWGFGHSIPFIGYAASMFICTALLVKPLPETRDKTLLEIQKELNS